MKVIIPSIIVAAAAALWLLGICHEAGGDVIFAGTWQDDGASLRTPGTTGTGQYPWATTEEPWMHSPSLDSLRIPARP